MPKTQEQVILDVENLFHIAMVKSDLNGLISICSDSIRVTNELGTVLTSPRQLINEDHLKVHAINVQHREMSIDTNVALVLTEEEHHFTLYGQRLTTRLRCNRIWKFNGRTWDLNLSTIHALPN